MRLFHGGKGPVKKGLQGKALQPLILLFCFLRGQLLSALRPAAFQDVASVLGGHALAESMHFVSLPLLWLICSFHYCTSFN